MRHSNELWLHHPAGTRVLVIGTQHVSATHQQRTGAATVAAQPRVVCLELDEARFQQVDFRFRHLLHADTASLMQLTAGDAQDRPLLQRLLPDALLWVQHMKQFALMRNEGVPLLLGSVYGADFLSAALAAAALPQPATVVLADQPQQQTLERFRQLVDTSGSLAQLLGRLLFGAAAAGAHMQDHSLPVQHTHHNTSSSSSSGQPDPADLAQSLLQQLQCIATAAAQLAVGRMMHLCLQWWSMVLTSRAQWYGDSVHPVFLLLNDAALQQKLVNRGCEGVPEAAAAAGRLLEVAAAAAAAGSRSGGSSGGSNGGSNGSSNGGCLPAVEDLQAIRHFTASLERVMWSAAGSSDACLAGGSSYGGSSYGGSSDSRNGSNQVVHWLKTQDPIAAATTADAAAAAGGGGGSEGLSGDLLPLRPWWVTLSERFSHHLTQLTALPPSAAAGAATGPGSAPSSAHSSSGSSGSLLSALQGHQHTDVTAAAAYDLAVMAERNWLLTNTLWQQAAAVAAAAGGSAAAAAAPAAAAGSRGMAQDLQLQQQQQSAGVVAVVGYNHLPGITQLWQQLELQHAQQHQPQQQQPGAFGPFTNSNSSSKGMFATRPCDYTAAAAAQASTGPTTGAIDSAAAGPPITGTFLPWQVAATDAAAGVLELAAAGGAGICYWALVNRMAPPAAAAATAASRGAGFSGRLASAAAAAAAGSSGGWRRLGLLLLPASAALLPLQLDAKRLQEAGELLSRVSVVNDVILRQQHGDAAAAEL